jgi:hypothetical protein
LENQASGTCDAALLWEAHRHGLPTIFYILRKQAGPAAARTAVQACLTTLDIAATDQATLLAAHAFAGADFEDDL